MCVCVCVREKDRKSSASFDLPREQIGTLLLSKTDRSNTLRINHLKSRHTHTHTHTHAHTGLLSHSSAYTMTFKVFQVENTHTHTQGTDLF